MNSVNMAKALFGKADLSMNQVITIGRELGSGGRTVGKEVARLPSSRPIVIT